MILDEFGSRTQEELTQMVQVDKAQTTRAIKSLMEKGLVQKIQSSIDRRAYDVSLTIEGKALAPSVKNEINIFEQSLNKGLTLKEQREMKRMLLKMIRNMKAENHHE
jgi:DNA-binding MarR family transcriptional regulator